METIHVSYWKPDYSKECEVCGTHHVVTGVNAGKVVYQGDMCGVCTWGEAAMQDPDNWNK